MPGLDFAGYEATRELDRRGRGRFDAAVLTTTSQRAVRPDGPAQGVYQLRAIADPYRQCAGINRRRPEMGGLLPEQVGVRQAGIQRSSQPLWRATRRLVVRRLACYGLRSGRAALTRHCDSACVGPRLWIASGTASGTAGSVAAREPSEGHEPWHAACAPVEVGVSRRHPSQAVDGQQLVQTGEVDVSVVAAEHENAVA